MKNISLKKLLSISNAYIIDVRENDEYLKYNIYNSVNIPYLQLYKEYETILDKSNLYYIICETGFRSKQICKFLRNKKYNVIYVRGGIKKSN